MRILIADDEQFRRVELKGLLSPFGDCDSAPNGELAYRLFEVAHEQQDPYHLVTLDFYLGDTRGSEVVQKIRDWERVNKVYGTDKETKIIMVTSSNMSKDIMASFREGCEAYIEKPATAEKIRKHLTELGFLKV